MTTESQANNAKMEGPLLKEGLELVKDGYYRHSDIVFKYKDALSPAHGEAMGSLINGSALMHPDHPLRAPGDGGLTLYIGVDKIGSPHLLYSIKQIQYLQYYIHEMRLTTPSWIQYHSTRADLLLEEDGETKAANLTPLSLEEGKDDWVPLPSYPCKASDLISVAPIKINSAVVMKTLSKQVQKDGREVDRYIRNGIPVKTYDINRYEAVKDNVTPGPGLRKGPEKEGRSDASRNEPTEGLGWGGFPTTVNNVEKEEETEKEVEKIAETDTEGDAKNFVKKDTEKDTKQDTVKETDKEIAVPDTPVNSTLLQDPVDSELAPEDASSSTTTRSGSATPYSDLGESYHYHCQQAFLIAISGGLLASFPDSQQPVPGEDDDEEVGPASIPPEIGRSLFIALSITKWEKDSRVILELGWSAIWWQKVPAEMKNKNTDGDSMDYEEMRDMGHFIVQDHLLHKKNGEIRPDYRDDYIFENSLPIEENKIRAVLKQIIKDLSAKAGNGPIYIVTHTPEGEDLNFKDIGLDISLTAPDLQPDGWDAPPYMCAAGCGSVFIINTATLFGSIEKVPSTTVDNVQQAGRTKKSLQHTAMVLFGSNPDRRPEKCGNAGNDAFYTLAMFVEIMTGAPLPELRANYSDPSKLPISNGGDTKALQTVPLTASADPDSTVPSSLSNGDIESIPYVDGNGIGNENDDNAERYEEVDEDDEDFMEDVMIKGIYYADDDGNLVELDD